MNARAFNLYRPHVSGVASLPESVERVAAVESGGPQARRGSVTATRFVVLIGTRWHRVYSDHTKGLERPHFVRIMGERVAVSGVAP